mmetsp:Transcript_42604/g.48411  ORF Transcript_42604/g.48411 Transcript_42604/m.48411 type:complete len:207 (-) Transcript_42604:179-799(-)
MMCFSHYGRPILLCIAAISIISLSWSPVLGFTLITPLQRKHLSLYPRQSTAIFSTDYNSVSKNDNNDKEAIAEATTELIERAKEYVANPTPNDLADDFIFRGPVIGPLNKKDFVATLSSVGGPGGITDAFPDLEVNQFGFSIDPTEPNRVWYFERPRGTFTETFNHPIVGEIEPTGAAYVGPPEARSVVFDDNKKVRYQSVGYVVD